MSATQKDDAEFAIIARNAFDVCMRRGWGVIPIGGGMWQAVERLRRTGVGVNSMIVADNPFTALVEADKWVKQQEALK